MTRTVYSIQWRSALPCAVVKETLRSLTTWTGVVQLHPNSRKEADRLVAALRRTNAMKEYRVVETDNPEPPDDIPF